MNCLWCLLSLSLLHSWDLILFLTEEPHGRVTKEFKIHAVDFVETAHLLLVQFGKVFLCTLVFPLDLKRRSSMEMTWYGTWWLQVAEISDFGNFLHFWLFLRRLVRARSGNQANWVQNAISANITENCHHLCWYTLVSKRRHVQSSMYVVSLVQHYASALSLETLGFMYQFLVLCPVCPILRNPKEWT